MKSFFQANNNPLSCMLQLLQVKYTKSFANKLYNQHPYKYSLFGLSSMLSDYKIENEGLQFNDKSELLKIKVPFIAQLEETFVVIYKIENKKVHYLWQNKKIILALEKFNKIWTGVVLLAEKTKETSESGYRSNIVKELFHNILCILGFILIVSGLFFFIIQNNIYKDAPSMIMLAINSVGIYISYLLLLKQMHIQNKYVDKICTFLKKGDCNNVLESAGSKLFGLISWSEVGFSYFISNFFILLAISRLLSYYAVINILALPYTIWSIWYQKFRTKQWCPLCLSIQVLLWILFILNLSFGNITAIHFSISDIYLCAMIYLMPFIVVDMLYSKYKEASMSTQIRQEINSLKMKDEVFLTLLAKQPYYEVSKKNSTILFGNKDAKNIITILTNPHCNPCAIMHKRVEAFANETGDKVCIQYIFSAFNRELEISNKFLIAAYLNKADNDIAKIYDEWYSSTKNISNNYIKKFNFNLESREIEEEFEKHQAWIAKANLHATPIILFNGYEIPNIYQIEDLKYFTDLNVDFK